jgi:hypothetical protein
MQPVRRRGDREDVMAAKCPICRAPCDVLWAPHEVDRPWRVACTRCGNFTLSDECKDSLVRFSRLSESQVANVSGYIRENQNLFIADPNLSFLNALPTPPAAEKATKLLRALARHNPRAGASFFVNYWAIPKLFERIASETGDKYPDAPDFLKQCREHLHWLPEAWAEDAQELAFLIRNYLEGFKSFLTKGPADGWLSITPEGWDYLQQLKASDSRNSSAFVAMWFDKSLNPVWEKALYAGIEAAGYEPVRIDMHEHNNRIDDEIMAMIRSCKFIVADFTKQRGCVYFEAGFALGLGKPVVWLCPEDELSSVHFDNRQYNFIVWSPDKLDDLKNRLRNRVEATIGKGSWQPVRQTR